MDMNRFFTPRAIAVIGASNTPGKIGYVVLNNIIRGGFKGGIYPVNPKGGELLGKKVYTKVAELPDDVELAVFTVPPRAVIPEVVECGKKGIKNALIITAGFSEVGMEGKSLEHELLETCLNYGIQVVGPNCVGIIDAVNGLNATFTEKVPRPGKIAFLSQSGAVCIAIIDWSLKNGVGFSKFISVGNKMDVDESKLIEFLADDPDTDVIVGYLESVKNGREFMEVAKRASLKKPIVLFKSGTTEAGQKAASSHTGALAGSDAAFDAACRQSGILRAPIMEQLFDFALAFSSGRVLKGNRVGIITNSGGPAVIATDSIEKSSLTMAPVSDKTMAALKSFLPDTANWRNPIDIIGDATSERYNETFKTVKDEEGIDGFLVIMTPTDRLNPDMLADYMVEFTKTHSKPVLGVFLGGKSVEKAMEIASANNICVIPTPERGVSAMDGLNRKRKWLAEDKSIFLPEIPNHTKAQRLIQFARSQEVLELPEQEARGILSAYGIRFFKSVIAQKPRDAVMLADNIGYPVVMKVVSRDVIHKSDSGGVKVGLANAGEVFQGFDTITSSVRAKYPDARIDGIAVQPMMTGGREVIVGASLDPQFGPLIMFGVGGIYVEAMKDVSFRLAPMSRFDARGMIEEIRSVSMLKGMRGEKPSDIDSIVDVILRVSRLMNDFPMIRELDLNPVLVFEEGAGCVALDARIALLEPDDV